MTLLERRRRCLALSLGLAFALTASETRAEMATINASVPAVISATATARALLPEEETAVLPPGHPTIAPDPDTDDESARGLASQGPVPGIFQPPPDTTTVDPSLPSGSVAVDARDADDKPLPNTSLVVAVFHQSPARGQGTGNRPIATDTSGTARLDHLEVGSEVSYAVTHRSGWATFASPPFRLDPTRGERVTLHVYPVARDLESVSIVNQVALYLEVREDYIQVEEALTIFNFGKIAWFPDNLVLRLPPGFTAVTSQPLPNDQGVDSVVQRGVRIRGTFSPGRHDLVFRWQLPYPDEHDLPLDVGLPPHVAIMRVIAATGRDTTLAVSGFPEPQRLTDRQGQRVLFTERQARPDHPLTSVHLILSGLVVPGPGRFVVTGVASLAVLLGFVFGSRRSTRRKTGPEEARASLLADLGDLENARMRGDLRATKPTNVFDALLLTRSLERSTSRPEEESSPAPPCGEPTEQPWGLSGQGLGVRPHRTLSTRPPGVDPRESPSRSCHNRKKCLAMSSCSPIPQGLSTPLGISSKGDEERDLASSGWSKRTDGTDGSEEGPSQADHAHAGSCRA